MLRRIGLPLATTVAASAIAAPTATAAPIRTPANAPDPTPNTRAAKATRAANVGHRGAASSAPENTIAGFKVARSKHANLFEFDVQETKDHQLVLMHDATLTRTTNVESVYPGRSSYRVKGFTLAQIKRLDAGSWFGSKYRRERVPTLRETLRAMRGSGLGALLEIKNPSLYPGIERRIALELKHDSTWLRPDPRGRRLIVQSFDWNSARRFHRLLSKVPIGLLGTPRTSQLASLGRWADQINATYTTISPSYVRAIHRHKMEIFTWTVDGSTSMRRVLGYGVDGVITNKPDVLARVLRTTTRSTDR
jgi:glycerophosphoryl diester phosphodiesterase